MSFRDYDQQASLLATKPKPAYITCSKCKCEWFEQVKATKFDINSSVAPGQLLPETFHAFTILRCVKCGDIQEVSTSISGWDKTSQDRYQDLIGQLEDKSVEPTKEDVKAG